MNNDKEIIPLENHDPQTEAHAVSPDNICRICLDTSSEVLISPCKCKGTGQFCHEKCLKTWILTKYRGDEVPKCEVCSSEYCLRVEYEWKVNFKRGIFEKSSYCFSIPILVSVVFALVVIVSIIAYSHMIDFKENEISSIFILIFCLLSPVIAIFLLARSIKQALFYREVKDLVILNL
jgi:hypothetical protein